MSLESRLSDLIIAIGSDIKALFGRGIPAGGTEGQVLTKSSATDYATVWQTSTGGTQQVFVQPTAPVVAPGVPYTWYQTGLGDDGQGMTIWVDDGL